MGEILIEPDSHETGLDSLSLASPDSTGSTDRLVLITFII